LLDAPIDSSVNDTPRRAKRHAICCDPRVRDTLGTMEAVFGMVLFAVVGVAAVVAVVTFASSGEAYKQIGKGGLSLGDGSDRPFREPVHGSAQANAERDLELRQMLEAKNVRRARRGEAPIDVDAELALLLAPHVDAEIEGEIRALVIARNVRRARRGEPPLDVEDEVARRLSALS
jgi:hypothetical protein